MKILDKLPDDTEIAGGQMSFEYVSKFAGKLVVFTSIPRYSTSRYTEPAASDFNPTELARRYVYHPILHADTCDARWWDADTYPRLVGTRFGSRRDVQYTGMRITMAEPGYGPKIHGVLAEPITVWVRVGLKDLWPPEIAIVEKTLQEQGFFDASVYGKTADIKQAVWKKLLAVGTFAEAQDLEPELANAADAAVTGKLHRYAKDNNEEEQTWREITKAGVYALTKKGDFKFVIAASGRKVYRNPLDPYAFDEDPHPHLLARDPHITQAQRREAHLGVHTSGAKIIATAYAISKARNTWLPGNEFNCGVVFELDTNGLNRQHDVDARIEMQQSVGVIIDELLRHADGLEEAIDNEDAEAVHEAVDRYAEMYGGERQEDYPATEWSEAVYREAFLGGDTILFHLRDLGPEQILSILREYRNTGEFSMGLVADAIAQYRYMEQIGLNRVLRIYAIRPIDESLETAEEYTEDDPDQPQRFSQVEIWEGGGEPDEVVLWENPRPIREQRDIETGFRRRVEYHGTDISRARAAFPEIAKHVKSPWLYGQ